MSFNDNLVPQYSLSPKAAKNLSHSTISVPMMEAITPRWLLTFLPWVSVEAGVYRLNKMKKCNEIRDGEDDYREKLPELCSSHLGEHEIPQTFPDYEEKPREYTLSLVQTILRVNGQVTDIFNSPINQLQQQMRLTIEAMKEQQEWEIVNNKDFGLINSVTPSMRVLSRRGTPTPDDMDELLAKVWKKPAFFLAHPRAIAAFGRECTCRGVPPATVNLYGSPFITWRGVPIVPCDKLLVDGKSCNHSSTGKTNILLMRVGEKDQGVIGLHQPGIQDESAVPSLSVRFAGIDNRGIVSYVITLYFGAAVLTYDSLGMLENVEVGRYHEYE
ncbi:MAG TPA: family 2A encapsulin nanocompartment shell protein [Clostridiales bacterium]|nr:family 2A encapsulin nanocompartment shell protein [Clostridiales bacterium]